MIFVGYVYYQKTYDLGIRPAIHGITEGVEHVGDDVYCFSIAMANEDYLRKVLYG